MSTYEAPFMEALDRVCADVIAPQAVEVDRKGIFPEAAMAALAKAGLLGAVSAADVGGLALGPRGAGEIVRRIAQDCPSTAMVVCMHFCGTAVLEAHADRETRQAAAAGEHLSTLAFSEMGSRSHFWAPTSTARRNGQGIELNAKKTWITSASHATAYVWSSQPLTTGGLSTIWLVPARTKGMTVQGAFDGLGLRGNDSSPVSAENVHVPDSAMLGEDGKGFDIMMGIVLPLFSILNAACTLGIMEAAVTRTAAHAGAIHHTDTNASLADYPTVRAYVARMRLQTDMVRALWQETIDAVEAGRDDAMLRVLECKAAAGETATVVLDMAMRVCGGAAFRKDVGVERFFRDGRAAGIMAPTTDVLYDFIGKAVCGLPLF